jgi:sulfur-oxidizing protein SoxZ
MNQPRIRVPATAAKDEVVMIRALLSHPMETGQRRDEDGRPIPRKIVNRFECAFNGVTVFACDIEPSLSANPFFEFHARVPESGVFTFLWVDDDGATITAEHAITVA